MVVYEFRRFPFSARGMISLPVTAFQMLMSFVIARIMTKATMKITWNEQADAKVCSDSCLSVVRGYLLSLLILPTLIPLVILCCYGALIALI